MELYKEILKNFLSSQNAVINITFPNLESSAQEIVDLVSYRALSQIQKILMDDTLKDEECFDKIEKIVRIFEELDEGFKGQLNPE